MARSSTRAQQVRAIARQRQADLAKSRAVRDLRILDLTTRVLIAIAVVQDARQAITAADVALGHTIAELLAEHVPVADAATLTGLPPGELARLRRLPEPYPTQQHADAPTATPGSAGSGVASSRVGSESGGDSSVSGVHPALTESLTQS